MAEINEENVAPVIDSVETETVATVETKPTAQVETKVAAPVENKGNKFARNDRKPGGKFGDKKFGDRKREPRREREVSEFEQKLVEVRRVAKVVAGGRTMRFSALVVVGNKKGLVGVGTGKASEVPDAIEKAAAMAKRGLISVPTVGTTIPHDVVGKFGASSVILLPAKEGSGVIAGGSARAVLELAGIRDITAKAHGSNNKINCVKATIEGLKMLRTREQIAALRGKSAEEI